MSDGIRLHKTKGVNAHMTVCPRCGKDGDSIVLLGAEDKKYLCSECDAVNYGLSKGKSCNRCGSTYVSYLGIVEDYEKVPALCKACEDELETFHKEIKQGGVFFRCTKCGAEGVIKGDSDLAIATRLHTGIKAPKPVGIELNDCPNCDEGGEE